MLTKTSKIEIFDSVLKALNEEGSIKTNTTKEFIMKILKLGNNLDDNFRQKYI